MNWCDQALGLADKPLSRQEREAALSTVKRLPVDALRRAWREIGACRYSDRTEGVRVFSSYFDSLGDVDPERALDFILDCVAREGEDELVALIGEEKLLAQLLQCHGAAARERLLAAARISPRLRWLLGSAYWQLKGAPVAEGVKEALLPLADRVAWEAWRAKTERPAPSLASASLEELARLWIEANNASPLERCREGLTAAMFNLCFDLPGSDREKAFDLALAILNLTDNANLLSLLATGLLEDLINADDEATIARVERHAAANPRFRRLIAGVWYRSPNSAIAARLKAARGDAAPF